MSMKEVSLHSSGIDFLAREDIMRLQRSNSSVRDFPQLLENFPVLEIVQMALGNPRLKNDFFLLAALIFFEVSVAVIPMAIYMKGDRSFAAFLPSKPGIVFLLAIGTLVIAGVVIIHQYLAHKRSSSSQFSLLVTMNLVTVILMIVTGEIVIRAASRSSVEGETVGGVVLRPKSWEMVAQHYRQLIDRVGGEQLSYLVYDDLMGWTVGPNRRSANGLYRSSSEGIRASEEEFRSLAYRENTDCSRRRFLYLRRRRQVRGDVGLFLREGVGFPVSGFELWSRGIWRGPELPEV